MVKYMGGVGTAMSQSEVYTALQQLSLIHISDEKVFAKTDMV